VKAGVYFRAGRHPDRCREGFQTLCPSGGYFGGRQDGGQEEAVRVPLADGTLVALPDGVDLSDDRLAAALTTLTDVTQARQPRRAIQLVKGRPSVRRSDRSPHRAMPCHRPLRDAGA